MRDVDRYPVIYHDDDYKVCSPYYDHSILYAYHFTEVKKHFSDETVMLWLCCGSYKHINGQYKQMEVYSGCPIIADSAETLVTAIRNRNE